MQNEEYQSWIGTIVSTCCDIDERDDRITDVYITVGVSHDLDTVTVRVSPWLAHLYHIGTVVQITVDGKLLIVTILRS